MVAAVVAGKAAAAAAEGTAAAMQRQQLARVVAQHLQRLQRSINRGNPASQAQALEDLLLSVDGADAAAKLHILQQSGILVTLKQVFDEFTAATARSNSDRAPGLAALLLVMLAGAGQLAVEHISAQPGMVPALARLLARSSTTAAADAFAAFQAANCLARLCSSEVAALHVAAVPAVVSGLVALLTVTEAVSDLVGKPHSLAAQAEIALKQIGVMATGGAAQLVLHSWCCSSLALWQH